MYSLKVMFRNLLILSIFSCSAVHANVVSIAPNGQVFAPGDIFSLTISGTDFTTPLDAGGIDLSFAQNIIQVAPLNELPNGVTQQVMLDPLWDVLPQPPRDPVIGNNSINDIFFFTSTANAIGDFDIATIWFKAISAGTSPIGLVESQLNPFAGGGGALAVTLNGTDVQVQVVPIPAAIWLMGSGLFGLISMKRLSRKR